MTLQQAYEAIRDAVPNASTISISPDIIWRRRAGETTVEWTVAVFVPKPGTYSTNHYQQANADLGDAVRAVLKEAGAVPETKPADLPALDAQLAEVAAMNDIHGDGLSELDANGRA